MHIMSLTKALRDAVAAGQVKHVELNPIDVKRLRSDFGGGPDITGINVPETGRHSIERDKKAEPGSLHINGVLVSTDGAVNEGEWRIVRPEASDDSIPAALAPTDPAPPVITEGDAA